MENDQLYERSLYEARFDATYAALYHELNARLCGRLRKLITFIMLASGTVAFSLVFSPSSKLGIAAGVALPLLAIIEQLADFGESCAFHTSSAKRFWLLLSRTELNKLDAFDSELNRLRADTPERGFSGIDRIAYNQAAESHGRPSFKFELSSYERLLRALL